MEFSPRSRNTDSWDEPFAPASTKLRLMCSYGGHIAPRPHDKSCYVGHIAPRPHDKSCYVGGDTRIIVAERATSFADLSTRLSKTFLNGRPFTLKYKLPNEDLDSLISVTTDEDLENMIGEYDLTTAAVKPSRIRLFLFPTKPDSTHSIPPQILNTSAKSDDWLLNASLSMDINGPYTSRALPPPQSQSLGNLQQRLQTLLEGARESWTHAIFWQSSYDSSSASILYWGDGYYKGEDDERKGKAPKTTSSSVEHAHRDTELFFLVSMTQSFVNGIGLPGQAFFNSSPVWVAGPDRLSELACERARQGLVYGLQTLVCIPCANGVVELGSTEVILPNPDLMNRVRLLFNPDFWISPNNPVHEPPPIKLLRKDIRLREREDTEIQNCGNNILSMQSRGKEKISDSKCSWSLLSGSSDGDTDSTFSRSDVYSGPS